MYLPFICSYLLANAVADLFSSRVYFLYNCFYQFHSWVGCGTRRSNSLSKLAESMAQDYNLLWATRDSVVCTKR